MSAKVSKVAHILSPPRAAGKQPKSLDPPHRPQESAPSFDAFADAHFFLPIFPFFSFFPIPIFEPLDVGPKEPNMSSKSYFRAARASRMKPSISEPHRRVLLVAA